MRSKIIIITVIAILAGVLGAFLSLRVAPVATTTDHSPTVIAVVDQYCAAWSKGDPATMYLYVVSAERTAQSQAEYIAAFEDAPVLPMYYKVQGVTINKDKAIVQVLIGWPGLELAGAVEKVESLVLYYEGNTWLISENESFGR